MYGYPIAVYLSCTGKHVKTISHPDLPRHNATSNGAENLYDYTPRFGRGAGPYVDKFVLQQKAEKTKRDTEHMVRDITSPPNNDCVLIGILHSICCTVIATVCKLISLSQL